MQVLTTTAGEAFTFPETGSAQISRREAGTRVTMFDAPDPIRYVDLCEDFEVVARHLLDGRAWHLSAALRPV